MNPNPHQHSPVLQAGAPLAEAAGVVILLHGRGASAEDILSLREPLHHPGLAWLAPQAAGHSWYPQSFLAPREANEPYLTSALARVRSLIDEVIAAGIPTDRIVIAGFSQGACLTSEFAATNPTRYAGLIAFTGGLIGPPDADLTHTGKLLGTPALLTAGDPDPHVPFARVQQTAQILTAMGAQVTLRRYPNKPHSIHPEELQLAAQLIQSAFSTQ